VLDWISENLAAPGKMDYEPFVPYREQEDFILRWYEIDPHTGRFRFHRGLLGRPRGWGKSPLLAALAITEALADVVPDGWDAHGQPVGKPWATIRTPLVHIAAVSEKQTRNTWQPLLEMLREGPILDAYPGLDPMDTSVVLPKGRIEQITAEARSTKGAPIIFATLDQTEEWVPSNHGPLLAQAIRTNAAKNGGRTLESPNAFVPGQESVAEASAAYASTIREGRARNPGLLYDHREAPADTDMTDVESLTAGLRVAYGDSSAHPDGCVIHDPPCPPGHSELDPLIEQIFDPASDVQLLRADLLNQITHASDSWVGAPEWNACFDGEKVLTDSDVITLGFDGSRGRVRGRADATALIGCRVSDGHLFEVGVWEAKQGEKDWAPPHVEIDAAVRDAFQRFKVAGFYCDPSGWSEYVAKWEAAYGRKLPIRASQNNPITVWPNGKTSAVVEHVERLRQAIVTSGEAKARGLEPELTHDGGYALTRHVLNARRRQARTGYLLYKAYPESPNKIDAAYAAVMAWKARLDAIAKGTKIKTGRAVFW
jgi:phage terminase large subunit-like protein